MQKKLICDSLKRSVTSRYYVGKISVSHQWWHVALSKPWKKKVWVTVLFLSASHSCHICRTTVCWDPEILLPWQRDVTTSLYVEQWTRDTLWCAGRWPRCFISFQFTTWQSWGWGFSRIKLPRNQQAKCSPVIVSEKMTLRICSSVILWLKWVCPCIQYLELWTWNCVLINM